MFYGYPMYFDSTYILVLIGAVFSLWASSNVNGSFKKYDKVRAKSGLTASQAAEMILHNHGIYDVEIRRISGNLIPASGGVAIVSDSVRAFIPVEGWRNDCTSRYLAGHPAPSFDDAVEARRGEIESILLEAGPDGSPAQ